MSVKLRIDFADFWPSFDKNNNFIIRALKTNFDVEISSEPDLIFFSTDGLDHLKYSCKRILYMPENFRPDFQSCDYALSFDYINDAKHLRWPVFLEYYTPDQFIRPRQAEEFKKTWKNKKKFCCILVTNSSAGERINFFNKLSKYKQVDSGGRWNNTVGHAVENKLNFYSDYKFVISFENSSYPGYTTEKLFDPVLVDSIPIYWGNPEVKRDINTMRIINRHNFESDDELIKFIAEVDQDEEKALEIISEPIFKNNIIPQEFQLSTLTDFLLQAVYDKKKPVAQTFRGRIYALKKKSIVYTKWILKKFIRSEQVIIKIAALKRIIRLHFESRKFYKQIQSK